MPCIVVGKWAPFEVWLDGRSVGRRWGYGLAEMLDTLRRAYRFRTIWIQPAEHFQWALLKDTSDTAKT